MSTAVTSYGYGINTADSNCHNNDSTAGAGRARYATGFTINAASDWPSNSPIFSGGSYSFPNNGTNGARLMCGDSGGPDAVSWPKTDPITRHIAGVHSSANLTGTGPATSNFSGSWISNTVGGLYLYPSSTGANMGFDSSFALRLAQNIGPHFVYSDKLSRVSVDFVEETRCVQKNPSGTQAMLEFCNGSAAQQWQVTSENRIRNPNDNTCLAESGNAVVVQTCASPTALLATRRKQTWTWRGRPFDPE